MFRVTVEQQGEAKVIDREDERSHGLARLRIRVSRILDDTNASTEWWCGCRIISVLHRTIVATKICKTMTGYNKTVLDLFFPAAITGIGL